MVEAAMKAFVRDRFGPPERLELRDVETPVPGEGEVLVRIRASSVNAFDWHHLRGEPLVARLMGGGLGLRRPALPILGADVAGEVAAVGPGVTEFQPGDEVYAMPKGGGFAEYVAVPASELAPKPAGLSYEQAAAVPMAALTALLGVRDQAQIQPGQKVLVNGASGGVGTFAVQLARAYGGQVTGVCSTRNLDLVRSLGAETVIDYTTTDFAATGQRYDAVIDVAGSRPAWAYRQVLTRTGILVALGGPAGRWLQPVTHVMGTLLVGLLVSQRMVVADVVADKETRANLRTLAGLIETGKVSPAIDRTYPFDEIPAAVGYVEKGHAPAKVVITV
jgi:NADPH:quinone reductase-like Zn-dependent oxidoreductase